MVFPWPEGNDDQGKVPKQILEDDPESESDPDAAKKQKKEANEKKEKSIKRS